MRLSIRQPGLYDGKSLRVVAVNSYSEAFAERLRAGIPIVGSPVQPLLDGARFVHIADMAEIDYPLTREAVELTGARTSLSVPLRKDKTFLGGLADGIAWRQWTGELYKVSEQAHEGAAYWAAQRSLANPGSCVGNSVDFQTGCEEAKKRLAMPDVLRKTQPDYRAGWGHYCRALGFAR
jgi:hypothetical protein